jgi:hypothetical protein
MQIQSSPQRVAPGSRRTVEPATCPIGITIDPTRHEVLTPMEVTADEKPVAPSGRWLPSLTVVPREGLL